MCALTAHSQGEITLSRQVQSPMLKLEAIRTLQRFSELAGKPGPDQTALFRELFTADTKIVVDFPASPAFGDRVSLNEYLRWRILFHGTKYPISARCTPVRFVEPINGSIPSLLFQKDCGGRTEGLGTPPQYWTITTKELLIMDFVRVDGALLISGIRTPESTPFLPVELTRVMANGEPLDTASWTPEGDWWISLPGKSKTDRLLRPVPPRKALNIRLEQSDALWEHALGNLNNANPMTLERDKELTSEQMDTLRKTFGPNTFDTKRSRNHIQFRRGWHSLRLSSSLTEESINASLASWTILYGRELVDTKYWEVGVDAGVFLGRCGSDIQNLQWSLTRNTTDPAGTRYDRTTAVDKWNESLDASANGLTFMVHGTRRFQSSTSNFPDWAFSIEFGLVMGVSGSGESTASADLEHSGTFPSLFNVQIDRPGILDFGHHEASGMTSWSGHRSAAAQLNMTLTHRLDRRGTQCMIGLSNQSAAIFYPEMTESSTITGTNTLGSLLRTADTERGWGPFVSLQFPL